MYIVTQKLIALVIFEFLPKDFTQCNNQIFFLTKHDFILFISLQNVKSSTVILDSDWYIRRFGLQ